MTVGASARSRLSRLLGLGRSANRLLGGKRSIPLARVLGIRLGATPSWFVATLLLIVLLAGPMQQRLGGSGTGGYVAAAVVALLSTTSIVLHELGHALTARRLGIGITGIDLWIFGGVARLARGWESPGAELRIVAAGPAATLVLVLVSGALTLLLGGGGLSWELMLIGAQAGSPDALILLSMLIPINLWLLVFNLVPAYPLDGGALLHALLWKRTGNHLRATRIAGRGGQAFAIALVGFGVALAAVGAPIAGVSLAVVGWMLWQAAHVAVGWSVGIGDRIEGMTVADVMDTGPAALALPETTSAIRAQAEFFQRYGWTYFPVIDASGRLLGVVTQQRVEAELAAERPASEVRELVDGGDSGRWSVRPERPLHALLVNGHLLAHGSLLVVDDGGVLRGVVTSHQLNLMLSATPAQSAPQASVGARIVGS